MQIKQQADLDVCQAQLIADARPGSLLRATRQLIEDLDQQKRKDKRGYLA